MLIKSGSKQAISEKDLIYLAGIIDGEGCIRLQRMPRSNYNFYGQILIVNTDRRLLSWLKESFGGDTYWRKHKNPKWKEMGTWRITHSYACELLEYVEPYLKLKRDQALTVITFYAAKQVAREENLGKIKPKDYLPKWAESFKYLKDMITELNRKGTYALT